MAPILKNAFEAPTHNSVRVGPAKSMKTGPNEEHDRRLGYLDTKVVGESPSMRRLKQDTLIAANSSSTVLITGESGTGKELIARALHDLSARRQERFLAINCGALTESLLESELFGHVKGAFTGATAYKKGAFEAANKGTIFLDEFGEMSSSMQVKLLRVLQERKVRPVGAMDAKEIAFHARVIVATNRDLKREIAEGRFRQDLYYRVNVLQIHSPALRDRLEDLPLLVNVILETLSRKADSQHQLQFNSGALELLCSHHWPGNVRELENIVERLAIAAGEKGIITRSDVIRDPEWISRFFRDPESRDHPKLDTLIVSGQLMRENSSVVSIGQIKRQELELYLRRVSEAEGNLAEAARRLKVKRNTLYMRIIRLRRKLNA